MMDIINGIIQSEPEIMAIVVSAIIIGLVKLSETLGVPKKFLPLVALVIGVILSVVYLGQGDIKKGILIGIWLGLGAVGLHSGIKNTLGNDDNSKYKFK